MREFDVVYAQFMPKRIDDLKPGARDSIGRSCCFQALWWIEEGPYAGQWAFEPSMDMPGVCWVPECDLVNVLSRPDDTEWRPEGTRSER